MVSVAAHDPQARGGDQSSRSSVVERRFRPELQGLRALAVVLVVVYHVWLGRVSGGVDVFFVISGFLITGQLFRAAAKDDFRGRIEFRPMWSRTIKRLVPSATVVLLVTVAASILLLPQTRWFSTIQQIGASALYMENWILARDSVDYYAQDNLASVVQHFWSLSIQGQFYVVWPLLVALVALVARLSGRHLRRTLFGVLLVVFVTSLAYSVWLTRVNQPLAYFHSLTRLWEFALGGLVALGVHKATLSRPLRLVLGWAGVLALPVCGVVTQVGSQFPGYLALWPTLCAAAVLVAGATESRWGADRILGSRPLAYIGDLSYTLYLWHWPVLIFYLVSRDRDAVGLKGGAVIIAISVALAVATHHLVENPVRLSQIGVRTRWGAYRLGAATLVVVLLAVTAWQQVSTREAENYVASVHDPDHPGALARKTGFQYWGKEDPDIAPPLVALPEDWGRLKDEACVDSKIDSEVHMCTGPTRGKPAKRIVLVGDSHAGQWTAGIQPIAEKRNWQLTLIIRGGCPFSLGSEFVPSDQGCVRWASAATDEIIAMHPDVVITMATRDARQGNTETTPPGYIDRWRTLDQAGIPVLAIRDTPRFDYSPPECANTYGANSSQCAAPRAAYLSPVPPYQHIANPPRNTSFLDFSDYFCTNDTCPPVIGNVLVYMDFNHPSGTYLTTMSPIAESAILTTMGW